MENEFKCTRIKFDKALQFYRNEVKIKQVLTFIRTDTFSKMKWMGSDNL